MSNTPKEIFNDTSGNIEISLQPPRNEILKFEISGTPNSPIKIIIIDSFQKSSNTLDDITAGATNKHFTVTDETKLDGIETGATADQTDADIETLYNKLI
jgi:hypothetical protein